MLCFQIFIVLAMAGIRVCHSFNFTRCRDFTFNECSYKVSDMITSSIGQDEKFCQFLCNDTYSYVCTYFLYDKTQKMCQIFKGARDSPKIICSQYGGPSEPPVSQCQYHDDKCQVKKIDFLFYLLVM